MKHWNKDDAPEREPETISLLTFAARFLAGLVRVARDRRGEPKRVAPESLT